MKKISFLIFLSILCNSQFIWSQIPDSLIVQNDSTSAPKTKLGISFGMGYDHIELSPSYFNLQERVGYYAGAGLKYDLLNAHIELSTGFKFVRAQTSFTDTNNWVRRYRVIPISWLTSLSYGKTFKKGIGVKVGGSLLTHITPDQNGPFYQESIADRTSFHTSFFLGIEKVITLRKMIIHPELRFNIGLHPLKGYAPYDEIKLHFLSLLLHFNNA
jgi:hypothetical protein